MIEFLTFVAVVFMFLVVVCSFCTFGYNSDNGLIPKGIGFFKSYVWFAKNLLKAFPLKATDQDPFHPYPAHIEHVGLFIYRFALVGFGLAPLAVLALAGLILYILFSTIAWAAVAILVVGVVAAFVVSIFVLKAIVKSSETLTNIDKRLKEMPLSTD